MMRGEAVSGEGADLSVSGFALERDAHWSRIEKRRSKFSRIKEV